MLTEPKGYIDFLKLMKESSCVISDSGGVQIETSYLNIPCLTVRNTTELKITIEQGTNRLVSLDPPEIAEHVKQVLKKKSGSFLNIALWDGSASNRIADEVMSCLNASA